MKFGKPWGVYRHFQVWVNQRKIGLPQWEFYQQTQRYIQKQAIHMRICYSCGKPCKPKNAKKLIEALYHLVCYIWGWIVFYWDYHMSNPSYTFLWPKDTIGYRTSKSRLVRIYLRIDHLAWSVKSNHTCFSSSTAWRCDKYIENSWEIHIYIINTPYQIRPVGPYWS